MEDINVEETAGLYAKHTFPSYGLPSKIISDRDPCFPSHFTQELCKILGIKQNISMAYHPQTDGQSEQTNQWLEQYLQFWCVKRQDDWHKWLLITEYSHNMWPSETTKKSPFNLIMGFTPQLEAVEKPGSVPSVAERLEKLQSIRDMVLQKIIKAQKVMKIGNPGNRKFRPYKEGDQVWVEGTNIKTIYPTAKLAPKRH